MAMHLKCPRCGSVDTYYTSQAGPHIKANCSICHTYIKFIPQLMTGETVMFYGKKYKGYKMKDIPPDYLLWIYDNCKLPTSIKTYIEEIKSILNQKSFEAK